MQTQPAKCDCGLLRARLKQALILADRCDPLVAIHVETALALLDERIGVDDQSSER